MKWAFYEFLGIVCDGDEVWEYPDQVHRWIGGYVNPWGKRDWLERMITLRRETRPRSGDWYAHGSSGNVPLFGDGYSSDWDEDYGIPPFN